MLKQADRTLLRTAQNQTKVILSSKKNKNPVNPVTASNILLRANSSLPPMHDGAVKDVVNTKTLCNAVW